jgi:hypothetical protein
MMADEKFHHSVYMILLYCVTLGLPSIAAKGAYVAAE